VLLESPLFAAYHPVGAVVKEPVVVGTVNPEYQGCRSLWWGLPAES
jgi:hypothetical protein